MSLFGTMLAGPTTLATETPLPTELEGTTITVIDAQGEAASAALSLGGLNQVAGALAPLFFVSPSQLNFLLPGGLASGIATVIVRDANGAESRMPLLIEPVAPALFSANLRGPGLPCCVSAGCCG